MDASEVSIILHSCVCIKRIAKHLRKVGRF